MKRFIAAAVACLGLVSPAFAACVSPLTGNDAGGTSRTFGVTLDGATNCYGNIAIVDGSNAANKATVTAGNALKVDGSAVTQPVSLTSTTITGTVAATQSGAWNITNISGTISLPTGASTAAGLTTINTTLGSPFQAGGALAANQSVNVSQINGVTPLMGNGVTGTGSLRVTVASDNTAFAVNAASTLSAETTKVIGTVRVQGNVGGVMDFAGQNAASPANSLLMGAQFNTTPTTITAGNASPLQLDSAGNLLVNVKAGGGAGGTSSSFAAAFPATGTAAGMSQGGNMVALTGTSGNLNVQCANCSGSGVSTADEAAFTGGSSLFAGGGGFFQTTATNNALTTGQQGMFQVTANRAIFSNLRNAAGTEVGTAGTPLQVSVANTGANGTAIVVNGGLAQASTTSGQSGVLDQCAVTTGAPTYTTAQTDPLSCDTAGNLRVNVVTATGLAQGSTTSGQTGSLVMGAVTTAAPTYTTAQTSPISLDTAGNIRINCTTGCSSSGGSSLADEGTFTQGTTSFTVTGGIFNNSVTNLTTGQAGAVQLTADRMMFTNLGKINGVAILTGAGAVGTGSERVAVGQDVTTIAGSAPGTAGAASANVVTVQGIASMTKLLVTPDSVALPANQSVNISQINGVTPLMGNGVTGTGSQRVTIASDNTAFSVNATLSAETTKVIGTTRITGNVGGIFDAATGATAPANALLQGVTFNSAAIAAPATGQMVATQADYNGNLKIAPGIATTSLTAITSATGTGAISPSILVNDGAPAVLLQLNQTTTITGGAVTIQGTYDGSNWVSVPVAQVVNPNTFAQLTNPYSFVASTNQPFLLLVGGYQSIRLNLTSALTGTGSVTPFVTLLPASPLTTDNIAQFGGSAVATGTGAGGAGIPRVTISNDSSLAANQSVNLAQVAGTNTVTGGLAGSQGVGGLAANGATISGNPLQGGGRAQNAEITAVTNGQQVAAAFDLVGKQIVMPYANKENFTKGTTAAMTATTSTQLIAAVASQKIYLTHIMCTNSHATVGTFIMLQDGSGGTTIYEGYAAAVGGGFSATLPIPIATTAGNGLFVADVTTGSNVICSGSGYSGT